MACPFFMPIEKLENGAWLHAHRLPLGCGWSGQCTAPGHEEEIPSPEELREFCNMGYAHGCGRMPRERVWDSVRFGVKTICADEQKGRERLQVRYVCERDHRPADDGFLEFEVASGRWRSPHVDARVQRMAECFVSVHLERKKSQFESLAS